jgi:hypothetical protein
MHTGTRKAIGSDLSHQYDSEGEDFLSLIVTVDETWVHSFETESKKQLIEWRYTISPRRKEFKSASSSGKFMATAYWWRQWCYSCKLLA